jgi:hypothetical protein
MRIVVTAKKGEINLFFIRAECSKSILMSGKTNLFRLSSDPPKKLNLVNFWHHTGVTIEENLEHTVLAVYNLPLVCKNTLNSVLKISEWLQSQKRST